MLWHAYFLLKCALAWRGMAALWPVFAVLCLSGLLTGGATGIAIIALQRHVGRAAKGVAQPEPNFLDHVSLDFGVAHTDQHYHVPLLVSPWSYSTYRGS